MYRLVYLPLALKDLENTVNHIADTLKNPQAAYDLIDTLDKTLGQLQHFPYLGKAYQPVQPIELDYRVLLVKNYLVFYVVTYQTVEIHRVIYKKTDLPNIIK